MPRLNVGGVDDEWRSDDIILDIDINQYSNDLGEGLLRRDQLMLGDATKQLPFPDEHFDSIVAPAEFRRWCRAPP